MTSVRRPWTWVWIPAAALAALHIQWTHALTWDEIEFFRATRWIAAGRLPYRDFWEHHTPLQWFVFAPFSVFANGPGVASVILLRWVQFPLAIATLAILFSLVRRCGASAMRATIAPLLIVASPQLLRVLIEYRGDVLGNFAYFAAVMVVIASPRSPRAWIAFGTIMSLAVLANMRLAPLAVATALLLMFLRPEEQRWGWNRTALWMGVGVAVIGAAFLGMLVETRSWHSFLGCMRFNVIFEDLENTGTLLPALLTPVRSADVSAIAIWAGGAAGCVAALRGLRRPGVPQVLALLAILSFLFVLRLSVHYFYHFETTLLLLVPLAVWILPEGQTVIVSMAGMAALLLIGIVFAVQSPFGGAMATENAVMVEVDRRTAPHERVFDGVGFALRREPAYRYWFLPAVVRVAARRGLIEPYEGRHMQAEPPGAIIYNYRIFLWFQRYPEAAAYAVHHYVPVQRNVWLPGLSGVLEPYARGEWAVPRAGRYRVYASEQLVRHPWFTRPLEYAAVAGSDAERFQLPLELLPRTDRSRLDVTVDGAPVPAPMVELRQGSVITVTSRFEKAVGVLVIPADWTNIFITPREPFQ